MSDLPVMVGRQVSPGEMMNTKNLKQGIKNAQDAADAAQEDADAAMAAIPEVCTGAEIDAGTDNEKVATPKAIADSSLAFTADIPVKATGAEIDTGTDDAKFATPKAIMDSNLMFTTDIDENTWTPTISFGGATTGITYSQNRGYYIRIKNFVFVTGYILLTSKGSATGAMLIEGLPYTIANATRALTPATLRLQNVTFANQFQGYGVYNTKTIALMELTEAGAETALTHADFANNSLIMVSLIYRAVG